MQNTCFCESFAQRQPSFFFFKLKIFLNLNLKIKTLNNLTQFETLQPIMRKVCVFWPGNAKNLPVSVCFSK